jgi:mannose-6-phosphate isomerase-like protein (cupin superfamily)
MGQVVTFATLPYRQTAPGVKRAAITGPEMKEMAAELIVLQAGASFSDPVRTGSDLYLFTLTGGVVVSRDGSTQRADAETFVTVQEGATVTVSNPAAAEARLIAVLAPPPERGGTLEGFADGLAVAPRASTPVHDIAAERKGRVYFVGEEAAPSDRAHAMIVLYEKDTVTGMHMHPNADSMFVVLSGRIRFTVNGEDVVVDRGHAACFPAGDRHGLRLAEGIEGSFLEFHIPAAYTTVRG